MSPVAGLAARGRLVSSPASGCRTGTGQSACLPVGVPGGGPGPRSPDVCTGLPDAQACWSPALGGCSLSARGPARPSLAFALGPPPAPRPGAFFESCCRPPSLGSRDLAPSHLSYPAHAVCRAGLQGRSRAGPQAVPARQPQPRSTCSQRGSGGSGCSQSAVSGWGSGPGGP